MVRYEYKAVYIKRSAWTGKANSDYMNILNEMGRDGWRFLFFTPQGALPKLTSTGFELVFERKMEE